MYTIGPIDPSYLVTLHIHLLDGEVCTPLVPKSLPLWIATHSEFRDGYESNYFTEEGEEDKEWSTVPHTVNSIYSKLLGEGFEDLSSGEVALNFGVWEIGYLLRYFTRLAETNRPLALAGMAHLCFLLSFLPPEQPASWPPVGLVWARWKHNAVVSTDACLP